MKKHGSKIIIGILVMITLAEGFLLYRAYAVPSENLAIARKITRIENIIEKEYTGGKVKSEDLENYTYKGLIAGLGDAYSTYYTADEFDELMESTNGEFSGVGLYLQQDADSGDISVVKVIKDSPAAKTKVKAKDILVEVDGKSVSGQDLSKVVAKVKGEKGTKVKLGFTRGDSEKVTTYTVTREEIESETVEYRMLDGNIGYLSISEFDEVTVNQFKEALSELEDMEMKSLIIDVRDNPGGLLTSVVDIADQLMKEGTIVYTKDKNGDKKYYKADSDCSLDVPMCLLVNENSASASEILTGTVKDNNLGTVVGEKTFGKGIVQGFYEVGDGSYVKLTSASYYTPSGANIHKKGIKPDVTVKNNSKTNADEQLEKAKEILSK